jgi:hypothetical protein
VINLAKGGNGFLNNLVMESSVCHVSRKREYQRVSDIPTPNQSHVRIFAPHQVQIAAEHPFNFPTTLNSTMSQGDAALLAAFESTGPDPDREPTRLCDDDLDEPWPILSSTPNDEPDPRVARILQDQQLRQQLKTGGAQTGPKGVLADYLFHTKQELGLQAESRAASAAQFNRGRLRAGWLQRQLAREEAEKRGEVAKAEGGRNVFVTDQETKREDVCEEAVYKKLDGDDEDLEDQMFMQHYRRSRLSELFATIRPLFGTFREIDLTNYVAAIDNEPRNVTVLIHLYQAHLEACRLTNMLFGEISRKYARVKFLRIVSTKADVEFDEVALPALLVYRGGNLVDSFMRYAFDDGRVFQHCWVVGVRSQLCV